MNNEIIRIGQLEIKFLLEATDTNGSVAAEPPKPDAVKKDMDEIQGTWKLVALEADGEQAPAEIVAALKLN